MQRVSVFGILCLLFGATFALENTVGTACNSNTTCTGQNEYCQMITWVSPPCQYGMCQCKPCYTTGDFSGYNWTPNLCAPIVQLKLGDSCTGNYYEQIMVANAVCSGGTVTCMSKFNKIDTTCSPQQLKNEGDACTSASECSGTMNCTSSICTCNNFPNHYDTSSGNCVNNNIGDTCFGDDAECQLLGQSWSGYNYDTGFCNTNTWTCDCNPTGTTAGNPVVVSYIDGLTGVFTNMTICVSTSPSVTTSIDFNMTCNTDPIYDASTTPSGSVQVCGSNLYCFACPEDTSYTTGRCRSVTGLGPVAPATCVIATTTTLAPTTQAVVSNNVNAGGAVSNSAALSSAASNKDTIATALGNNQTAINLQNTKQCSSATTCTGLESCAMPAQCLRGVCSCKSPNRYDSAWVCQPPPSTSTSTTTTSTTGTTSTSTTTITTTTITTTTTSTTTTSTSTRTSTTTTTTTTTLPPVTYNSSCAVDWNCSRSVLTSDGSYVDNGLRCLDGATAGQKYCLCPSNKYTWRDKMCKIKDYGDPCTAASDCDNVIYTAEGYATCKSNKCDCANDSTAVIAAHLGAIWGSTVPSTVKGPNLNRTYCVKTSGLTANVAANSNCTIGVVDQSRSATAICTSGLVCLVCPMDVTYGTCIKFTYPSSSSSSSSKKDAQQDNAGLATAAKLPFYVVLTTSLLSTWFLMANIH